MRVKQLVALLGLLAILALPSNGTNGMSGPWNRLTAMAAARASAPAPVVGGGYRPVGAATPSQTDVEPSIDGDKTPDRIPDEIAYRHFIMAASQPQVASKEQVSQRASYLALIGLSEADTDGVIVALATVREGLDAIKREQAKWSDGATEARTTLLALHAQKNAILGAAQTRLQSGLSADGIARVDRFVREHVKARIRIYGQ